MNESSGKLTVASRNLREKASDQEAESRLSEAAETYEKILSQDPMDSAVVKRLLIIYRKLKEYRKELKVIDTAIAAYGKNVKEQQDKWARAHPAAAKASRSLLRSLQKPTGREQLLPEPPLISSWRKRRVTVGKKIKDGSKKIK